MRLGRKQEARTSNSNGDGDGHIGRSFAHDDLFTNGVAIGNSRRSAFGSVAYWEQEKPYIVGLLKIRARPSMLPQAMDWSWAVVVHSKA